MEKEKTMEEALEEIENRETTPEEFMEIVVKPIRAAYLRPDFLSTDYEKDYWYKALRFYGYGRLERNVENWIIHNAKLPVLANIYRSH